jgi:hypothetical protein
MRTFLGRIGVQYNGRNANIVKDHLAALFASDLSVEGLASNGSGHGVATEYFKIARSSRLWWGKNDDQEGLWPSDIRLSDEFFDSIRERPVPIDLNALRALGGSSMRLDIYIWPTHRVYYLTRETKMKWDQLNIQFGAQYKQLRQFRAAFKRELEAVSLAFPQLNFEVTTDYLSSSLRLHT